MDYPSLLKALYTNQDVEALYHSRLASVSARQFPFFLQQSSRTPEYPAFFLYTEEFPRFLGLFSKRKDMLARQLAALPPIALQQFMLGSIIYEVKSTNEIEGIHSTRREIQKLLEGSSSSRRLKSIVLRYQKILEREEIPFQSPEDIRHFFDSFAHEEVIAENPKNRLDGVLFRKESVDIVSGTGKILHQGLYPEGKITSALAAVLQILQDEKIPALVRIFSFHYFFAYIHPFYDGNGRTARFITSYFLAREYSPYVALRLSLAIKKQKKKYYRLFQDTENTFNRGDLTPFVLGLCEILAEAFEDTIRLLARKTEQLKCYTEKLRRLEVPDSLTQELYEVLLQAALFSGTGATMTDLTKTLRKSRVTIQARLDSIPTSWLVVEKKKAYTYKLNLLALRKLR